MSVVGCIEKGQEEEYRASQEDKMCGVGRKQNDAEC